MAVKKEVLPPELKLAIGLVWGHLNARQFEDAYKLARACLFVWPEEPRLIAMLAFASVEIEKPLDSQMIQFLKNADCQAWSDVVLRRAHK